VDQCKTLVAEARYIRSGDSGSAEFALVVADNWRRIGLGSTLTRILAQRARIAGVLRLYGDVLEDNKAIARFGAFARCAVVARMGCLQVRTPAEGVNISAVALHRRSRSGHRKIEPPRGNIARAFLEIPDHATPIRAAAHKSGSDGRKVYVDVPDSRVRKVLLRACRKDGDGLAGLDDGKTFARVVTTGPRAIGRPDGVWSGKWIAAHGPI